MLDNCALLPLSLQHRQDIIIINANKAMAGTDKWLICWIWINGEVPTGSEARFCLLQLFPNLTPIPLRSLWDIVFYLFLPTYLALDEGLLLTAGLQLKPTDGVNSSWWCQWFSFDWSLPGRRKQRNLSLECDCNICVWTGSLAVESRVGVKKQKITAINSPVSAETFAWTSLGSLILSHFIPTDSNISLLLNHVMI